MFKLECDGLFCVKIFGLIKDYECLCGKYKCLKYCGVICEKCGVEVMLVKVCCEWMGYIELVLLVVYIWFLKLLLLCLGMVFDMMLCDIECVLYFEVYVVIELGMMLLKVWQIMIEEDYYNKVEEYGDEFCVEMGVEGVCELLCVINIDEQVEMLCIELKNMGLEVKIKKYVKCLKVFEVFQCLGIKFEWMIFEVLLVLLLELCLFVLFDGGCFVMLDLNDLYCCVINCNNWLKCLFELKVFEIIVCNEKWMLQEVVDLLFDNGCCGKVMMGVNKCLLKLFVDMIKGKGGCFCQNLLGKCVDYLGCLVIVVGLMLKLYQCGLLKLMVFELFKLFIFNKLEVMGVVMIIKVVKKEVENQMLVVWDIFEEVICEYLVMLNCVLMLYCFGIQVFELVLIEGKVIQLYLFVCVVFNVDFDGDQMVVYVLLLFEVQMEVCMLMFVLNNVLFLVNGDLLIVLLQDIVLGLYYVICEVINGKGEGLLFMGVLEVICVYENKEVELVLCVNVWIIEMVCNEDMLEGVLEFVLKIMLYVMIVGCVILLEILLYGLLFLVLNKLLKKKEILCLINMVFCKCGLCVMVVFVDQLMQLGFCFVMCVGILICVDDMFVLLQKEMIVGDVVKKVKEYDCQYMLGFVIVQECYNNVVDIWLVMLEVVGKVMMEQLLMELVIDCDGNEMCQELFNLIYMMVDLGVWGLVVQICQLVGM